jgi:hypothetical protein
MWHPYRYLIAGRSKWEIAWFDLNIMPDPRAFLEKNLVPKAGPLIGFEPVPGARPLSNKEAMAALEG